MKTMILATATVIAALLFAPMAYAYDCRASGNEIRCMTRDLSDLDNQKITVKIKKMMQVSFIYATSIVSCGEDGRPIGPLRVDLGGGHAPSRDLSFQRAVNAFTDAQLTYKRRRKEACFEVIVYNCEERIPPSSAKIACDLVLDVMPGGWH